MEKRFLGKLEVSPVGMGCMGLSHGYGDIPDEKYSIEAIRKAYEFGCTFFDTAEGYGPNLLPENRGHNEKIVGKALKDVRDKVVIATKFKITKEEAEKGVEKSIREHLMASLERLQTKYVDLYYLHRVNKEVSLEEIAKAMGVFIKEGLIKGWGLSQVSKETIERAHKVIPVSAVQNIYSMVERGCEEDVIPYCVENNIGFVPFSPTSSGLFSGKLTVNSDFSHSDDVRKFVPQLSKENLVANQPVVDLVAKFAKIKNCTPTQIALAWMLKKYPKILVPIPGSKNQGRILENLGSWNVKLSDEEFKELDGELNKIEIKGYRGYVEYYGGTMADWGKNKK